LIQDWLHLCRKGIAAAAGFIRKIARAQIFPRFAFEIEEALITPD
jgi:hypothetical protein